MSNLGAPFGSRPGVPGFVDEFSQGVLGEATGFASQAMANRYNQLGIGVPGASPQSAAASHTNLSSVGPGTAQRMDLGGLPSLVGGIPGMAEATMGQMQNAALNPVAGSVKK